MYYGRLRTYYSVLLIELPTFWSIQINRKREINQYVTAFLGCRNQPSFKRRCKGTTIF